MTKLVALLLMLGWKLEGASSLMQLPFAKTTTYPRRRGSFVPGLQTLVDQSMKMNPPAITPTLPLTAVFGILPNHSPEDLQLFLSFQDNLGAAAVAQDAVSQITNNLLSQSQSVLQNGILQFSSSFSQAQDELTALTASLQSGIQDQLSTLENLQENFQSSTGEQILAWSASMQGEVSLLSSAMQDQVSTLSTSLQSGLVAQWGALMLLWSELQSSMTFELQDQVNAIQTGVMEQLAGLVLVVKNAETSAASLWQDETTSLSKLLPSIQEQLTSLSGWTEQQQQVMATWLSSIGQPSFSGEDWNRAFFSQWQEQLSDANQMVKTVVTGLGLVMGAYFVFGPQSEEEATPSGRRETPATIAAMTAAEVPEKSQLDLVLEQVSMVEQEHKELEKVIWQGNKPPAATSMAAAETVTVTLDKPFSVDEPNVLGMPSAPTPTDIAVVTFFSSTANYLGSSTIAKDESVSEGLTLPAFTKDIGEDIVVASSLGSWATAATVADESSASSEVLPSTDIAPELLATESEEKFVDLSSTADSAALRLTPTVSYLESLAKPAPLRLSTTVSYLESLADVSDFRQNGVVQLPSTQSYLASLSGFEHVRSYTTKVDEAATVEQDEVPILDISIQDAGLMESSVAIVEDEATKRDDIKEQEVTAVDASMDVNIAASKDAVKIVGHESLQYLANADGATDWPLKVSPVASDLVAPASESSASEMPLVDDPSSGNVASSKHTELTLKPTEDTPVYTVSTTLQSPNDVSVETADSVGADDTRTLLQDTEERDWASLSDEISSGIWSQGEPTDEPADSTLAEPLSSLSEGADEKRDWAGLSEEIGSDIWNQDDPSTNDSRGSESLFRTSPISDSDEPRPAGQGNTSSDVWNQENQSLEATPRKPMTALLRDEDNEIREYIKAKAAQKTRERLQEQQAARRNNTTLHSAEENELTDSSISLTEAAPVNEDTVVEVEPSINAREETMPSRTIKNEIEAVTSATDMLEIKPKRLLRVKKAKPKLSKKRILTAVAVVAVVVGQRALTAVLNRSLL